jgi:hypothetical protein
MSVARQHVWVGPEATSFEADCEACQARREQEWSISVDLDGALVVGTLRREADVGFTTCRRGHRIVVHRVGRANPRFPVATVHPAASVEHGPMPA